MSFKKLLSPTAALLGFIAISGVTQAQTVLWSEDFQNQPPAIWNKTGMQWISSTGKMKTTYNIYRSGGKSGSYPKIVSTDSFQNATDATFKYKVNFDTNNNTDMGGKFFGVGPAQPVTGCNAVDDLTWSARVGFRDKKPQLYLYYQGKTAPCGEIIKGSTPLARNRWYDVSLYVKVNSNGSTSDAEARLYIDGQEVAKKTNFRFYKSSGSTVPPDAKIQKFLLHTFLGSIDTTAGGIDESVITRYDDFQVVRGKHP